MTEFIVESSPPTAERAMNRRGARIVIATQGSLGDVYPYIAIALGLKGRGHEAIVATGECYRKKIEALGIGFRPVRPDSDWVTDPEVMRQMMHPRWGLVRVIREIWLPALRETYEDTLQAAEGADFLLAMQASYAGSLVAEKKDILWASAMHIPLGFSSAYDPSLLPGFEGLSKQFRRLGPTFWKPLRSLLKWKTRYWAKPLYCFRDELGLPPDTTVSPLTDGHAPLLHLALFSKHLADKQPDWPPQTIVTGFPWYDGDDDVRLSPTLNRFLDEGPPPILFTLGTAAAQWHDARGFFEQSAAAAKLLGRRAVLILKDPQNRPPTLPEGVASFDYARFSELFPRAAVVVHHGGIGTTGLAMRSGRPMLVMPCAWDQPDNAERAARLGIARIISRRRYTAARVATELRQLFDDPKYSRRAAEVGEQVRQENGVRVACDALLGVLQANPRRQ
jgi:rhamnosyltransferase subunit B